MKKFEPYHLSPAQSLNSEINTSNQKQAFTITEILISISLTGLVITFVSSVILSQLKHNMGIELRQRLAEDWGRTAEYIESDIFASERAYPVEGSVTGTTIIDKASDVNGTCDFAAEDIKLALVLADSTKFITYAVSDITSEESRTWEGPFLLKRCGPQIGDLNGSGSPLVITGNLSSRDSFSVVRGVNALGGATAARDVSISLTIGSPPYDYTGKFGGQARVNPSYNLINDEATTGSSCTLPPSNTALLCGSGDLEFNDINCPPYTGTAISRSSSINSMYNCGLSRVRQFKPSGTATVIGTTKSGIEDSIYFPSDISTYSLTGKDSTSACNKTYCKVAGGGMTVDIYNGDVLVFRDREIRL